MFDIEKAYSEGRVPDRYYYQLNRKSAAANYQRQKEKKRRSQKQKKNNDDFIFAVIQKILSETVRQSIDDIFKDLII